MYSVACQPGAWYAASSVNIGQMAGVAMAAPNDKARKRRGLLPGFPAAIWLTVIDGQGEYCPCRVEAMIASKSAAANFSATGLAQDMHQTGLRILSFGDTCDLQANSV